MRVEVDRDRCEGNAVCVGIAPDLFDLDDEDYALAADRVRRLMFLKSLMLSPVINSSSLGCAL